MTDRYRQSVDLEGCHFNSIGFDDEYVVLVQVDKEHCVVSTALIGVKVYSLAKADMLITLILYVFPASKAIDARSLTPVPFMRSSLEWI